MGKKIDDFHIYASGLCAMSVCVVKTMPKEEIENRANMENPTGISCPWKISEDKKFADGNPNPCDCEEDKLRRHWLLYC